MRHYERTKRALYWTAISLIVCEGLPLEQAARRMGVDPEQLKDILHRRRTVRLDRHAADAMLESAENPDRAVH